MASKTPYKYGISIGNKWFTIEGNNVKLQDEQYLFDGYVANWRDLTFEDMRNWRMGGFYRSWTPNVQFVKGLAKVVRSVYYTYGEQAHENSLSEAAKFHLYELNTETQEYEINHVCELDFYDFEDERDQAICQLMQGGIQELIKNNEDVEYEIPISGSAVKAITIEPFRVYGSADFLTIHQNVTLGSETQGNQAGALGFWPSIQMYNEEFIKILTGNNRPIDFAAEVSARGFIKGQQILQDTTGWASTAGSYQNFLFRANVALENVRLELSLPSFIKNNDASNTLTIKADVYIYDEATPGSETVATDINGNLMRYSQTTFAASGQGNHTFNIDGTMNVPAGYRVYLLITANHSVYEWNWEAAKGLKITYQYFTSQFAVNGLQLFEVGRQLVSKATNGTATFESNLLTMPITYKNGIDCRPESVLLMSGLSVMQDANAKIKISITDYLKICDVLFCAGLGIEGNTVKVEKRSYFFQRLKTDGTANVVAHLSKLQDWRISNATDIKFNELHIGHAFTNNEDSDLNGRDEFNTVLKFTTSAAKSKNVMDLVSPAIASGVEIFRAHIKVLEDKADKDDKNDNSLFLLQYKYNPAFPAVGTALYPSDISSTYQVSGVTDTDRVLNIGLSPKRCLIRHLYWLLSHFYNSHANTNDYLLKYQTTDRNPNLQARLSTSLSIAEASDVYLDQEATNYGQSRLFYPLYAKPETVSPRNYKQLWAANRYGVFTTDIEGVTVEGFPLSVKERNEVPKVNEIKLLLTAANNPKDLIR